MKTTTTKPTAARSFSYAVEIWDTEKNGKREIEVIAGNRRGAESQVRKMGHTVRAVNFLG